MSTEAPDELARVRAERDVALQRLQELSAAHDGFLHAVSHDLRAPLRHVTSYAALLHEVLQDIADPPAQAREALGFAVTMQHSARRMVAMLDGLQAISHAHRAPLKLDAVDLSAVLAQTLQTLEGTGGVQWRVQPDLPLLRADAALLAQVLRQVLGNAVKFSRGCESPCVQVTGEPLPGQRVRIRVTDNGVGFDDERAQGVPGVFQRLHREDEFEGVGTGLALCQLIAQRHGASLALAARPGAGCTVTLDWPAA